MKDNLHDFKICKYCKEIFYRKDFIKNFNRMITCGSLACKKKYKREWNYSNHCLDCGKPISRSASKCHACASLGKSNPFYGKTHTKEMREKLSEYQKERIGEKSYRWKGGRCISNKGYIFILVRKHPFCSCRGYIMEHRLVMEKYLGRYLASQEVVHHINKVLNDNRIDNLMLFANNAEHIRYHKQIRGKDGIKN